MKLKNITNSPKELTSKTGERILVGPKKTIEVEKPSYNLNSFKIIEVILNRENRTKTVRRLKTHGTSK